MNNKKNTNIIYFDNNGTTLMSQAAKNTFAQWMDSYNPSIDSKLAKPAKTLIQKASDDILSHCGVSIATHTVIFTSGGTESNCLIIRACVKAYKKKLLEHQSYLKPHVILSATEHPSILHCINDLIDVGDIEATQIQPSIYGHISPKDVEKEIKSNTCLITIMYANNEIPIINNIQEIGKIAHDHKIPLHSDCVQIFGKYKINMKKQNVDAISASAHKFYGPKGIGLLIISNTLIEGYQLTGEINGAQQFGLRGGTENVAGIASMVTALKTTFISRHQKNNKLFQLRQTLLTQLKNIYPMNEYTNYVFPKNSDEEDIKNDLELVSLGPPEDLKECILPNTVLLAICKNRGRPFCNVDLKKTLDKKNIIVSIGSACATESKHASHVLTAIGAPKVIQRGVIRISFGDQNTIQEVHKFVKELKHAIELQCKDLK